jgi:hypothetical protein
MVRASQKLPEPVNTQRLMALVKSTYLRNTTFDKPLGTTSRVHDADLYPGGGVVLEQMRFMWFPWSLANYATLARDASLAASDREFAVGAERALVGRLRTRFDGVSERWTYEIAEDLIGLSYHLICAKRAC